MHSGHPPPPAWQRRSQAMATSPLHCSSNGGIQSGTLHPRTYIVSQHIALVPSCTNTREHATEQRETRVGKFKHDLRVGVEDKKARSPIDTRHVSGACLHCAFVLRRIFWSHRRDCTLQRNVCISCGMTLAWSGASTVISGRVANVKAMYNISLIAKDRVQRPHYTGPVWISASSTLYFKSNMNFRPASRRCVVYSTFSLVALQSAAIL